MLQLSPLLITWLTCGRRVEWWSTLGLLSQNHPYSRTYTNWSALSAQCFPSQDKWAGQKWSSWNKVRPFSLRTFLSTSLPVHLHHRWTEFPGSDSQGLQGNCLSNLFSWSNANWIGMSYAARSLLDRPAIADSSHSVRLYQQAQNVFRLLQLWVRTHSGRRKQLLLGSALDRASRKRRLGSRTCIVRCTR